CDKAVELRKHVGHEEFVHRYRVSGVPYTFDDSDVLAVLQQILLADVAVMHFLRRERIWIVASNTVHPVTAVAANTLDLIVFICEFRNRLHLGKWFVFGQGRRILAGRPLLLMYLQETVGCGLMLPSKPVLRLLLRGVLLPPLLHPCETWVVERVESLVLHAL
ncbi:MAG: hypothetical protein ACKPKO_64500, partial [Candidatus Fonsibacter sp.]